MLLSKYICLKKNSIILGITASLVIGFFTVLQVVLDLQNIYGLLIAGSIMSAREYFEKAMWAEIKTFAFTQSAKKIKIEWSETEGDFQVFGAAAVYLDRSSNL